MGIAGERDGYLDNTPPSSDFFNPGGGGEAGGGAPPPPAPDPTPAPPPEAPSPELALPPVSDVAPPPAPVADAPPPDFFGDGGGTPTLPNPALPDVAPPVPPPSTEQIKNDPVGHLLGGLSQDLNAAWSGLNALNPNALSSFERNAKLGPAAGLGLMYDAMGDQQGWQKLGDALHHFNDATFGTQDDPGAIKGFENNLPDYISQARASKQPVIDILADQMPGGKDGPLGIVYQNIASTVAPYLLDGADFLAGAANSGRSTQEKMQKQADLASQDINNFLDTKDWREAISGFIKSKREWAGITGDNPFLDQVLPSLLAGAGTSTVDFFPQTAAFVSSMVLDPVGAVSGFAQSWTKSAQYIAEAAGGKNIGDEGWQNLGGMAMQAILPFLFHGLKGKMEKAAGDANLGADEQYRRAADHGNDAEPLGRTPEGDALFMQYAKLGHPDVHPGVDEDARKQFSLNMALAERARSTGNVAALQTLIDNELERRAGRPIKSTETRNNGLQQEASDLTQKAGRGSEVEVGSQVTEASQASQAESATAPVAPEVGATGGNAEPGAGQPAPISEEALRPAAQDDGNLGGTAGNAGDVTPEKYQEAVTAVSNHRSGEQVRSAPGGMDDNRVVFDSIEAEKNQQFDAIKQSISHLSDDQLLRLDSRAYSDLRGQGDLSRDERGNRRPAGELLEERGTAQRLRDQYAEEARVAAGDVDRRAEVRDPNAVRPFENLDDARLVTIANMAADALKDNPDDPVALKRYDDVRDEQKLRSEEKSNEEENSGQEVGSQEGRPLSAHEITSFKPVSEVTGEPLPPTLDDAKKAFAADVARAAREAADARTANASAGSDAGNAPTRIDAAGSPQAAAPATAPAGSVDAAAPGPKSPVAPEDIAAHVQYLHEALSQPGLHDPAMARLRLKDLEAMGADVSEALSALKEWSAIKPKDFGYTKSEWRDAAETGTEARARQQARADYLDARNTAWSFVLDQVEKIVPKELDLTPLEEVKVTAAEHNAVVPVEATPEAAEAAAVAKVRKKAYVPGAGEFVPRNQKDLSNRFKAKINKAEYVALPELGDVEATRGEESIAPVLKGKQTFAITDANGVNALHTTLQGAEIDLNPVIDQAFNVLSEHKVPDLNLAASEINKLAAHQIDVSKAKNILQRMLNLRENAKPTPRHGTAFEATNEEAGLEPWQPVLKRRPDEDKLWTALVNAVGDAEPPQLKYGKQVDYPFKQMPVPQYLQAGLYGTKDANMRYIVFRKDAGPGLPDRVVELLQKPPSAERDFALRRTMGVPYESALKSVWEDHYPVGVKGYKVLRQRAEALSRNSWRNPEMDGIKLPDITAIEDAIVDIGGYEHPGQFMADVREYARSRSYRPPMSVGAEPHGTGGRVVDVPQPPDEEGNPQPPITQPVDHKVPLGASIGKRSPTKQPMVYQLFGDLVTSGPTERWAGFVARHNAALERLGPYLQDKDVLHNIIEPLDEWYHNEYGRIGVAEKKDAEGNVISRDVRYTRGTPLEFQTNERMPYRNVPKDQYEVVGAELAKYEGLWAELARNGYTGPRAVSQVLRDIQAGKSRATSLLTDLPTSDPEYHIVRAMKDSGQWVGLTDYAKSALASAWHGKAIYGALAKPKKGFETPEEAILDERQQWEKRHQPPTVAHTVYDWMDGIRKGLMTSDINVRDKQNIDVVLATLDRKLKEAGHSQTTSVIREAIEEDRRVKIDSKAMKGIGKNVSRELSPKSSAKDLGPNATGVPNSYSGEPISTAKRSHVWGYDLHGVPVREGGRVHLKKGEKQDVSVPTPKLGWFAPGEDFLAELSAPAKGKDGQPIMLQARDDSGNIMHDDEGNVITRPLTQGEYMLRGIDQAGDANAQRLVDEAIQKAFKIRRDALTTERDIKRAETTANIYNAVRDLAVAVWTGREPYSLEYLRRNESPQVPEGMKKPSKPIPTLKQYEPAVTAPQKDAKGRVVKLSAPEGWHNETHPVRVALKEAMRGTSYEKFPHPFDILQKDIEQTARATWGVGAEHIQNFNIDAIAARQKELFDRNPDLMRSVVASWQPKLKNYFTRLGTPPTMKEGAVLRHFDMATPQQLDWIYDHHHNPKSTAPVHPGLWGDFARETPPEGVVLRRAKVGQAEGVQHGTITGGFLDWSNKDDRAVIKTAMAKHSDPAELSAALRGLKDGADNPITHILNYNGKRQSIDHVVVLDHRHIVPGRPKDIMRFVKHDAPQVWSDLGGKAAEVDAAKTTARVRAEAKNAKVLTPERAQKVEAALPVSQTLTDDGKITSNFMEGAAKPGRNHVKEGAVAARARVERINNAAKAASEINTLAQDHAEATDAMLEAKGTGSIVVMRRGGRGEGDASSSPEPTNPQLVGRILRHEKIPVTLKEKVKGKDGVVREVEHTVSRFQRNAVLDSKGKAVFDQTWPGEGVEKVVSMGEKHGPEAEALANHLIDNNNYYNGIWNFHTFGHENAAALLIDLATAFAERASRVGRLLEKALPDKKIRIAMHDATEAMKDDPQAIQKLRTQYGDKVADIAEALVAYYNERGRIGVKRGLLKEYHQFHQAHVIKGFAGKFYNPTKMRQMLERDAYGKGDVSDATERFKSTRELQAKGYDVERDPAKFMAIDEHAFAAAHMKSMIHEIMRSTQVLDEFGNTIGLAMKKIRPGQDGRRDVPQHYKFVPDISTTDWINDTSWKGHPSIAEVYQRTISPWHGDDPLSSIVRGYLQFTNGVKMYKLIGFVHMINMHTSAAAVSMRNALADVRIIPGLNKVVGVNSESKWGQAAIGHYLHENNLDRAGEWIEAGLNSSGERPDNWHHAITHFGLGHIPIVGRRLIEPYLLKPFDRIMEAEQRLIFDKDRVYLLYGVAEELLDRYYDKFPNLDRNDPAVNAEAMRVVAKIANDWVGSPHPLDMPLMWRKLGSIMAFAPSWDFAQWHVAKESLKSLVPHGSDQERWARQQHAAAFGRGLFWLVISKIAIRTALIGGAALLAGNSMPQAEDIVKQEMEALAVDPRRMFDWITGQDETHGHFTYAHNPAFSFVRETADAMIEGVMAGVDDYNGRPGVYAGHHDLSRAIQVGAMAGTERLATKENFAVSALLSAVMDEEWDRWSQGKGWHAIDKDPGIQNLVISLRNIGLPIPPEEADPAHIADRLVYLWTKFRPGPLEAGLTAPTNDPGKVAQAMGVDPIGFLRGMTGVNAMTGHEFVETPLGLMTYDDITKMEADAKQTLADAKQALDNGDAVSSAWLMAHTGLDANSVRQAFTKQLDVKQTHTDDVLANKIHKLPHYVQAELGVNNTVATHGTLSIGGELLTPEQTTELHARGILLEKQEEAWLSRLPDFKNADAVTKTQMAETYGRLAGDLLRQQYGQEQGLLKTNGREPMTNSDIMDALQAAYGYDRLAQLHVYGGDLQLSKYQEQQLTKQYVNMAHKDVLNYYAGKMPKDFQIEDLTNVVDTTMKADMLARQSIMQSNRYQLTDPVDQKHLLNESTAYAHSLISRSLAGRKERGLDAPLAMDQIVPLLTETFDLQNETYDRLNAQPWFSDLDPTRQQAVEKQYHNLARNVALDKYRDELAMEDGTPIKFATDLSGEIDAHLAADASYYEMRKLFGGDQTLRALEQELLQLKQDYRERAIAPPRVINARVKLLDKAFLSMPQNAPLAAFQKAKYNWEQNNPYGQLYKINNSGDKSLSAEIANLAKGK